MADKKMEEDTMEASTVASSQGDSTTQQDDAASSSQQDGADTSTDVEEPFSRNVLNLVSTKFSQQALQALSASWPTLNPDEQTKFVTSSAK